MCARKCTYNRVEIETYMLWELTCSQTSLCSSRWPWSFKKGEVSGRTVSKESVWLTLVLDVARPNVMSSYLSLFGLFCRLSITIKHIHPVCTHHQWVIRKWDTSWSIREVVKMHTFYVQAEAKWPKRGKCWKGLKMPFSMPEICSNNLCNHNLR